MVKDELCGTYWYCVNRNGSKWLVDGSKPIRSGGGYCSRENNMTWLNIDNPCGRSYKNGIEIHSSDFKEVKFPDRTYEDGPLEIEIVKSGNVYWYDSNTSD